MDLLMRLSSLFSIFSSTLADGVASGKHRRGETLQTRSGTLFALKNAPEKRLKQECTSEQEHQTHTNIK